ncbi:MAG TPA: c-type cytochrome [Fluviicoccus sp.]|nr:c-type cytochrome [Fluviicoccus sp.]
MIQRLALLFVFSTLVSACGSKPAGLEPVTLTEAQGKLFENSCKNCHAQAGNPAPQLGDQVAWEPRVAKGLDVLVKNAITGINQMPAGGMCITCTPQDYEALIRHMAAPAAEGK